MGTLKASVSHLQYENDQLRRKVATLESENRQVEQTLVQERSANGDLTARLDNARTLLGERGEGASDVDSVPARTTLPTGRSSRKRRKPPFAQIPGRLDAIPSENDSERPDDNGENRDSEPTGPGAQSRLDPRQSWLPVARDATESSALRR